MSIYTKINAMIDERLTAHGLIKNATKDVGADDVGTTERADAAAEGSSLSHAATNADSSPPHPAAVDSKPATRPVGRPRTRPPSS